MVPSVFGKTWFIFQCQVFSGYSLPLNLAEQAQCWDGDIIAEDVRCRIVKQALASQIGPDLQDHHAFLKAWFYFVFESRKKEAPVHALELVQDGS